MAQLLPKELIVIILKYTNINDLINSQILTKNKNNNIFNLSLSLIDLSKGYNHCHKKNLLLETELSIYCQNISIKSILNYNIGDISLCELKHILKLNKNNLKYEDNCKRQVIHFICQYQDFNTIKYILENYKINIECEDIDKNRPIHFACKNKNPDLIILLLNNYDINIECKNNNELYPFYILCIYQSFDTIKYYLENKKINKKYQYIFKCQHTHFMQYMQYMYRDVTCGTISFHS
jgi:hypothetical protein